MSSQRTGLDPAFVDDDQVRREQATAIRDDWPNDPTIVAATAPQTDVRKILAIEAALIEAYAQGKRDGGGELGQRGLELLERLARTEPGDSDPDLVLAIQALLGEAGRTEARDLCQGHLEAARAARTARLRADVDTSEDEDAGEDKERVAAAIQRGADRELAVLAELFRVVDSYGTSEAGIVRCLRYLLDRYGGRDDLEVLTALAKMRRELADAFAGLRDFRDDGGERLFDRGRS